ncbi:MAG: tetratricopeptide repeat protein [Planctomycetota bacterium]|jgi:tetratricopeptide (TPR) repeat protein
MAKKRLNKKVALIGSAVFVLLFLVAIVVILRLSGDPEELIRDGDAMLIAARAETDEKIKEETYKKAERNYHKARSLAKNDPLKIEILYKLVDLYIETDEWRYVPRCWGRIISIDPEHIKARFGQLKYIYIIADSGVNELWQQVVSQTTEFIEVAENTDLFMEDTAKLTPLGMQDKEPRRDSSQQLGPYLYLLRGRANLELATLGAATNPDELLEQATNDLKKVQELQPKNVDAYWFLAQAVKTKGQILASRGNVKEKNKAAAKAIELLQQAVKVIPDEPIAHTNLLNEKLTQSSNAAQPQEQIQLLEDEYLSLVKQFPSSAQAYLALAEFYKINLKNLDKAIEATQKAVDLDTNNVTYAIQLIDSLYRRFSIYGHTQDLYESIEVAKNALTLPDAQEETGPRQRTNIMNRAALYIFLASCYIEQVLEPCEKTTEAQKQQLLTNAEQTVYEIEQILGSGEDVQVVIWRGMLELAKGNHNVAIKKLYSAYEQLKAIRPPQPPWPNDSQFARLSYTLAKIFKGTAETGAVAEFLTSALRSGITWVKPEVTLDYVELLLKLRVWTVAADNVNSYEQNYGASARSQTLRFEAFLRAGQFDEAEKELTRMTDSYPDDPNITKLNLALVQAKIRQVQTVIVQKKMEDGQPDILKGLESLKKGTEPSEGSTQFMTEELKNYWKECAGLVKKLLPMEPDNTTLLIYNLMLSEPEPHNITQERRKEIEEQVLLKTADPTLRAMDLGLFYKKHNETDKAIAEYKKVFSSDTIRDEYLQHKEADGTIRATQYEKAVMSLFDLALKTEDWQLAEQIAETAQRDNLDGCDGQFFGAHLAVAKKQNQEALAKLNECLKQKPVFSSALAFRSTVNAALGNEHASIEDAQKAASLNPLDPTIAKVLANALYERDKKIGANLTSDQMIETRNALERVLRANPGDLQTLSFYAEYISKDEPLRALAIRQKLQKVVPSIQNAVLLARLAMTMALNEINAERKSALLAIADSSFEQAQAMAPENRAVIEARAEYYRRIGQQEKAVQLLMQDKKLLWSHYFRTGQFDDAKQLLEQLYKNQSKDINIVKGLFLVAETQADEKAVKKYSEELILLEDNIENNLAQIQSFLRLGLVKEADLKLQSFKEKYPQENKVLLLEAWLAMRQGQLQKALQLTNRNLEGNQNNAQAWRLRGQINLLMANHEQAISDLKLSKTLLDTPLTRIPLAKAYRQTGRYEDAIIELHNTIDMPGASMEGRVLLEQIYLQLGRKEELNKYYDDTLQKLPDSVLWYNRVGAFALAEAEFDRAEKLFEQAWQKSRQHGKGDTTAIDGYLQTLVLAAGTQSAGNWVPGKLDQLFVEARKYTDGDFAHIVFFRMAEAKLKLGDKATAIQYCRKAVDRAGVSEILAAQTLQRMYSLLGAEEALAYCNEKLEANPELLAANYAMFNLTNIIGQYNKAESYINKCLQIVGPDSTNRVKYIMEKAEILTLAYNKTSDNKYLKKAITEYESLLDEMPNNMSVLNNLAYMLANNNERLTEALQYAQRSLQARPNSPDLLDTYAYVLHKNGRHAEAAESLQAAMQQYESRQIEIPAEVYEHLGMVEEKLGEPAKAVAAYKQALLIGTDKLPKATEQRITLAIERLSQ